MAGYTLFLLKKPSLDKADLNLSLITFYLIFMMSYGWVTEQSFLDPLPFIFLQMIGYRFKRSHLYMLIAIQILIYAFSAVNHEILIFEPILERFFPLHLVALQNLYANYGSLLWTIRGIMGSIISLFLGVFLTSLSRPSALRQTVEALFNKMCARKNIGKIMHAVKPHQT